MPNYSGSPACPTSSWKSWLWGALLVLLVAVAYGSTLDNGFIWDDDYYVENNVTLRSGQGLHDIWFKLGAVPQYYPLVHSSFWIEYHLWGLDPRGYHAVNLLLHAGAVVVLWRLLARLAVPGAWLAAAIFAVHPVHVESVAWVTERKNVLSCLLALGSLLAYLRFSPPEAVVASEAGPSKVWAEWRYYVLALVLYVAALFSKTVTSSMPAVLLVIYWWKRGRFSWRDAARLAPFFAVGLALAGITVWMERTHVGAEGQEWDLSPVARLLIAGRAVWFYAGKLAWPYPLIFFYPRWTIDEAAWWQYLFPGAALAALVLLWLVRKQTGRGPLAATLIFGGVLIPAVGFFNVYPFRYSFVADHFQYHASIALTSLAAAAATLAVSRFAKDRLWLGPTAGAGLLLTLALVTWERTFVYKNSIILYQDTIARNPTSWVAHYNLGNRLLDQGKYDEAIEQYHRVLASCPNDDEALNNLAICLQAQGKYDEALDAYHRVVTLRPHYFSAYYNLGVCLQKQDNIDGAIEEYRRAIAVRSDDESVHYHLANCLRRQGKYDEAIDEYRRAVALRRDDYRAWHDYTLAFVNKGDLPSAVEKARQALAINPQFSEGHDTLGCILFDLGKTSEAIEEIKTAARLQPDTARYCEHLGLMLIKTGDPAAAEAALREAMRLDPQSAEPHNLLGVVLGQRGDIAAAIAQFETALSKNPQHPGATDNLNKALQSQREAQER